MPADERTDLVLTMRQYAFVRETTRGALSVLVGPYKTTLSQTEKVVVMDRQSGQLRDAGDQATAIQSYTDVNEGEYVILANFAVNGTWPQIGKGNDIIDLAFGRQVNLPGPISFPLWPFQKVTKIPGHRLNMNEYVVVRVINEDEAFKNWDKAIVKTTVTGESGTPPKENTGENPPAQTNGTTQAKRKSVPRPDNLSVGQLIIIKGTEVSFYIPPTGLEVVADERNQYVRSAVTLEQLEYCVLVNQSGKKRFEKGPQVVFPEPSETFRTTEEAGVMHFKFRATELTQISGLHIKVTEPYEEDGKKYIAGDEIFITGKDQPIYFPRPEHAVIRYDDQEVHYATAVPKGDGRYVLDRFGGNVSLARGPRMLLPNPCTEVLVKRILSDKQVQLLYPGNAEALRINQGLAQKAVERGGSMAAGFIAEDPEDRLAIGSGKLYARHEETPARLVGDRMKRQTSYTPPRTITLDTKYEGAVKIDVWTGYAVQVIDCSGNRRVVKGPQTILLEFDETLGYMGLSTSKPKNTDKLYETAYLRVLNNIVSDIVSVQTSDLVDAKVKLTYKVNFAGPEEKWFDVENYVKLLCDHARSMIRNMVKKIGIQDLNSGYIDLIRDTILGKSEGTEGEKKKRPGMSFVENGMVVYDVEVLGLEIGTPQIASLLVEAQLQTVRDALQVVQDKRKLVIRKEAEEIARETDKVITATALEKLSNEGKKLDADHALALAKLKSKASQTAEELAITGADEKITDLTHHSELEREKLTSGQKIAEARVRVALELEQLGGQTKELTERAKAITPQLIAALQAFGDQALVGEISRAMAPMAILGGSSVAEVAANMFKGSGLEKVISEAANGLSSRVTDRSAPNATANSRQ